MTATPKDDTEHYKILGLDGQREVLLISATKLMHELGLALSSRYSFETQASAPRSINQVVKNLVRNSTYRKIYAQDKAGIPITLGSLVDLGVMAGYSALCINGGRSKTAAKDETYSPKDVGELVSIDFLENPGGHPNVPFHEGAIKRIIIARVILDATDRFRTVCEYAPASPQSRKKGQDLRPQLGA